MTSKIKKMLGFGSTLEKARDNFARELRSIPDKEERKRLLETTQRAERLKNAWIYQKFVDFKKSKPNFTPENEQKLHNIIKAFFKLEENNSFWIIRNIIEELKNNSDNPELNKFLNQNLIDLFIDNKRAGLAISYRNFFEIKDETELCKKIVAKNQAHAVFDSILELGKDKPKEFFEDLIQDAIKTNQFKALIIHYWRFEDGLIDIDDIVLKYLNLKEDISETKQIINLVLNLSVRKKLKQETLKAIIQNDCADLINSVDLSYKFIITNPTQILEELINLEKNIDYQTFFDNNRSFSSVRDLDISYALKIIEQDQPEFVILYLFLFRDFSKSENVDLVLNACISKDRIDLIFQHLSKIKNIPGKYIKTLLEYKPDFIEEIFKNSKRFIIESLEDEEYLAEALIKKDFDYIVVHIGDFKFYKFKKDIALKMIKEGKFFIFVEKIDFFEKLDDEVALEIIGLNKMLFFQAKLRNFTNLGPEVYKKLKEMYISGNKKTAYNLFLENPTSFNESLHVEIGNDLIDVDLWEELLEKLDQFHDPEFKIQRRLIAEKVNLGEVFSNIENYEKFNQEYLIKLALEAKASFLIFENKRRLKNVTDIQIVKQFIIFNEIEDLEKGFDQFSNLDIEVLLLLIKMNKLDLVLENIPRFKKNTHNRIAYECLIDGRTIELFETHITKLTNIDIIYLVEQLKVLKQVYILNAYLHVFPRSIQEEISKLL